jgi:hypothetical protein
MWHAWRVPLMCSRDRCLVRLTRSSWEDIVERYMNEGLMEQMRTSAANSRGGFSGKALIACNMMKFTVLATIVAVLLLGYFGSQVIAGSHDAVALLYICVAVLALMAGVPILRVGFRRLEAPQGRMITRSEAPRLFETLDKLCRKLDGPPIHHVLINRDYGASLVPLRARAIAGEYTNYLVLGLPYMLGAPAKEMLSAIARDYGYLCGTHGKLAARAYRQNRTFAALAEQIQRKPGTGGMDAFSVRLFQPFMKYHKAQTAAYLRSSGLAAEAASTRMFGPQIRANGLIRDALLVRWIEREFWPKLMKQAENSPRPTFMPFAAMRTAFDASYEQWATREQLTEVWIEPPGMQDVYPSLRERVEAIGQPGMLPARVKVTAAGALLEDAAKRIIDEFDQSWWKEEKKNWDVKFLNASRSKSRVRDLADFKMHEQKELASLRAEFDSLEAAKPVLEDLLKQPGGPFPKAAYLYGRILLDENNDLGLEHLTVAANNDPTLTEEAAHAGYFYLLKKHGDQAAQDWWEKFLPATAEV